MANRVTIDVEARFVDKVSAGMNTASKSADKLEKSVEKANKGLDALAKKNAKPKLGADDNAFTKKIREAQRKAEKLGKTKVSATLGAVDKATAKIGKVTGAARAFGSKIFKSTLSMSDKASHVIGSVTGAARSFAGKTFSAAVDIVDKATTPLRKIKDSLFSIKTLIGAITAGFAAKQFVVNPINLADQYSGAKIGFSTLLGESEGQAMMNEIDAFAKATPFKTSNTISSIQKMMAYGWDATRVIEDMKTIGDAAAATGKGDQGLESIVYALSEIRSKGKLSTQELNQLASAGIKAKAYLAEGLGFGTSDEGMMKLSEALEDGAVGANQAIELILQGMKEFDGMMDKTANETVEGLWSQIQDTFEINIFRKWGQGLQDGAKRGFGSIVELLNTSEAALEDFGEIVYDIGKEISNWAADKLENTVKLIKEITATDTWQNASLGDKIKILWDEVIAEPFDNWWNGTGKPWMSAKMEEFGRGLGTGISNGLLALLGVDVVSMAEDGMDIGASFAKGFADGFDGSAITDALVDAIGNVWDALPTWAKVLVGGYIGGKTISGIGNVVSGISTIAGGISSVGGTILGSTGNAMMQGTGLLNVLANAGYGLTGGAAASSLTPGMAALAGGASIAGGIAAGASVVKGGFDFYNAVKAYKAGDKTEGDANTASGLTTLGGVAAGAAIGSIFGPVGTLVGAGIGGVAGWIGGDKWADNIRSANLETQEMKDAIADSEMSAEDMAMEFERAVNSNIADHFGDIKLSLEEIEAISKKVVIGDKAEALNTFTKATEATATSLQNLQTASDSLDKLNWKVGLGFNLDSTEIEAFRIAVDSYIQSAKFYVENQHYEFTAAASLLLDVTDGDGKAIVTGGNTFYDQLKGKIGDLGGKLTDTVNKALEDGVISTESIVLPDGTIQLSEQEEIINLQNQIAEITNKLAEAETEAKFETIKIKFGESNISVESFNALQSALQSQLEESTATYENALTVGLTNLKLQYDAGIIDETEYERLKGVLEENFNTQITELNAKVNNIQLEIIGEAYEDVLGEDAVEKLNEGIQSSLKAGINPAKWSTEEVRNFLNVDTLSEETAGAISLLLSNMEFDVPVKKITPNIAHRRREEFTNRVIENLESGNYETEVDVAITPSYSLKTSAGASKAIANTTVQSLFPDTSLTQNASVSINPTYSLMKYWTPPSFNKTIYPTITVSPSYKTPTGAPYKQNANGSIVQSKTLSWVGEEGPEAIIPLVPGRRSRGLKLWEEAGKRLGVQYHANGGIVGDDNTPIKAFEGEIHGSGEKKIEINMGGVTIEIQTDGNKTVAENIEEQEQAIAEKVAAIFKNVFSAQFANMPLKEGT